MHQFFICRGDWSKGEQIETHHCPLAGVSLFHKGCVISVHLLLIKVSHLLSKGILSGSCILGHQHKDRNEMDATWAEGCWLGILERFDYFFVEIYAIIITMFWWVLWVWGFFVLFQGYP